MLSSDPRPLPEPEASVWKAMKEVETILETALEHEVSIRVVKVLKELFTYNPSRDSYVSNYNEIGSEMIRKLIKGSK